MPEVVNETRKLDTLLTKAEAARLLGYATPEGMVRPQYGAAEKYGIRWIRIGVAVAYYAEDVLAAGLERVGEKYKGDLDGLPREKAAFMRHYNRLMADVRQARSGPVSDWMLTAEALEVTGLSRQGLMDNSDFGGSDRTGIQTVEFSGRLYLREEVEAFARARGVVSGV